MKPSWIAYPPRQSFRRMTPCPKGHSSDVISEFAHYPENEEEDQLIQISNIVQRNGKHELYNKSTSAARKTLDELLIDLRGA